MAVPVNPNTIGGRIRTRRKEIGMTQEELAHILGFDNKSAISSIEVGRTDISIDNLLTCADALETTLYYLLGLEPEKLIIREHDELCTAYENADAETRYVVDRILGLKRAGSHILTNGIIWSK